MVDLGSKLGSEGSKKCSDEEIFLQSASNCLLGHHIQFLGQSMKIYGSERIFASGGESTTFPPHLRLSVYARFKAGPAPPGQSSIPVYMAGPQTKQH